MFVCWCGCVVCTGRVRAVQAGGSSVDGAGDCGALAAHCNRSDSSSLSLAADSLKWLFCSAFSFPNYGLWSRGQNGSWSNPPFLFFPSKTCGFPVLSHALLSSLLLSTTFFSASLPFFFFLFFSQLSSFSNHFLLFFLTSPSAAPPCFLLSSALLSLSLSSTSSCSFLRSVKGRQRNFIEKMEGIGKTRIPSGALGGVGFQQRLPFLQADELIMEK